MKKTACSRQTINDGKVHRRSNKPTEMTSYKNARKLLRTDRHATEESGNSRQQFLTAACTFKINRHDIDMTVRLFKSLFRCVLATL